LKFKESTFFERTALHEPRGVVIHGSDGFDHSSVTTVPDRGVLLRTLRQALTGQAAPVVDALFAWSGFARRGTWGMLTSSWAAHFTALAAPGSDQRSVLPILDEFFEGSDLAADMRPRLHAVRYRECTHVYQRRASCCRFYLVPEGELCASCPLVSQEERVARNLAWMKQQIDSPMERRGHS
jgi:FhuF 2Fe-2S C-terminal domain